MAGWQVSAQPLNSDSGPRANRENSPYSRYGIGDLSNDQDATLRGMGGPATAYSDPFSVNSYNPASYSFLQVASLDFALEARKKNVFLGDKNTSSGTATLAYFNLGLNLGKYAGMNIGFKPISRMYYNADDTINIDGIGKSVVNYNGSGSLQYAYLGLSGQYKGFSIGFNAGYAFGTFNYSSSLQTLGEDTVGTVHNDVRSAQYTHSDFIGGFYWKGGLIYHATLKKDHFFNAGAAITLSQKLDVKRTTFDLAYNYLVGDDNTELITDTLTNTQKKGILQMPAEYALGFSYGKTRHWSVNADVVYTDWSAFQKMGDRTGVADNAWRAALGAEFTPDNNASTKKYLSFVTYRIGAYYGKDYLSINQTDVNYVGGTIGASFPLQRSYNNFGRINLALDMGQRGTNANGLAKEFFVRFTFGISLNDSYWLKRRPQYD